ncbi:MAG: hypothetical protein ACM31C_16725, partial [Acidobacteriota bacterium]
YAAWVARCTTCGDATIASVTRNGNVAWVTVHRSGQQNHPAMCAAGTFCPSTYASDSVIGCRLEASVTCAVVDGEPATTARIVGDRVVTTRKLDVDFP